MTNELHEAISPKARRVLYLAYGLIGVLLGAIQVGFSSAELAQPTMVTVALAVYAFLGSSFGVTAYSNVNTHKSPAEGRTEPLIQHTEELPAGYEYADDLDRSLRT